MERYVILVSPGGDLGRVKALWDALDQCDVEHFPDYYPYRNPGTIEFTNRALMQKVKEHNESARSRLADPGSSR